MARMQSEQLSFSIAVLDRDQRTHIKIDKVLAVYLTVWLIGWFGRKTSIRRISKEDTHKSWVKYVPIIQESYNIGTYIYLPISR